jgi:hypothetical protein
MTAVDLHRRALEPIVFECPLAAPPAAERRPLDRHPQWWKWLAASAVFVPGGGLAYRLLSEPEE